PLLELGDFSRLKPVLDTLISNAIKYAPPATLIELSVSQMGQRARVLVKDQGPGFSAEDKEHVYGYFQRLSAQPTAGESSTGVGLAIVKQIVDLHQGHIQIDSEPGQGAIFVVDLPLYES
ncbi:MAG: sensor histidine kinase, partial [Candidatus Sericytochromatia bacterium]